MAKSLEEKNLVFLLSMPRAGSTLLQRSIVTGGCVTSPAEPWLILAHLFVRRSDGACSVFGHETSAAAVNDFVQTMAAGERDYDDLLRNFILGCYGSALKAGTSCFVDKTPRNALVVRDIIRIFPNSRFLFLWRNPISVIASMIDTFDGGRWNIDRYNTDLFVGLPNLIAASETNIEHKSILNYESLVEAPMATLKRVSGELKMEFNVTEESLSTINSVEQQGRMGDPTGRLQYKAISTEPVSKWVRSLASPFRKAWVRDYLRWLGEERLSTMGYSFESLDEQLDSIGHDPAMTLQDCFWRPVFKGLNAVGARYFSRRSKYSRGVPVTCDIY